MIRCWIVGSLVLALCGTGWAQNTLDAHAELRNISGDIVGTATFTETAEGVEVQLEGKVKPLQLAG